MTDQHCPGFESNKSLTSVNVTCPKCGKEVEVFSDEMEKSITCPECKVSFDPKVK